MAARAVGCAAWPHSTARWRPAGAATREAAGVGVGDTIHVELERDDRRRVLELPPELEAALAGAPEARAAFDGLSFTHRREYAEWVGGAKRAQTRERRLVKAIAMLRAGVKHP